MLTKQAKTLSAQQINTVQLYLSTTRNPARNNLIFLLSIKAGLRAKEIASITWAMVTDASGDIADTIYLTDCASKGKSGGAIPIAPELKAALIAWRATSLKSGMTDAIIWTERARQTTAQVIVNLFHDWYAGLGFNGCSSHSGRRTFITNVARKISLVGGSVRDVQALARHSSMQMTQKYIELDIAAQIKVLGLI